MPRPLEEYVSQRSATEFYKTAFWVWLLALLTVLLWNFIIILPALLVVNRAENAAAVIYNAFGYICHQMPDRSFHILDHQFAVCSRCFGVYFGLLCGLVIYPLFRRFDSIEPFPRIWLILACFPLAIDFSLTFFGVWENTFVTRTVTGLILGIVCAVYILPAIIEISQHFHMKKYASLGVE